jgi:hypothetical protein
MFSLVITDTNQDAPCGGVLSRLRQEQLRGTLSAGVLAELSARRMRSARHVSLRAWIWRQNMQHQ